MIAYRDNEQVIIEIKKIMLDSKVNHREVAERIGLFAAGVPISF